MSAHPGGREGGREGGGLGLSDDRGGWDTGGRHSPCRKMKDRGADGAISMKFLEKMQAGGVSKDLEFICFFPGKKPPWKLLFLKEHKEYF